jgi:hypothetical protein
MRARWLAGRGFGAAAVPLAMAAVLIGPGPAVAPGSAGLRVWAQPLGEGSAAGILDGGAAGSVCRDCFGVQRWGGPGWQPRHFRINPLSTPVPSSYVPSSVAATSPRNAWVVGGENTDFDYNPEEHTWIEHWDGSGWARQASPNPGACCQRVDGLSAVAATSPTSAWAVGSYYEYQGGCCTGPVSGLILRWDGTRWARVPDPYPGWLVAVAATSPGNAWAVGDYNNGYSGGDGHTVILHWDGTAWTRVPSPYSGPDSYLRGVAAASPGNAWAVGQHGNGPEARTLILHWDGTAWTRVPSPSPGPNSVLSDVVASSPTSAWAIGGFCSDIGCDHETSLIEHWDGTAWTVVSSPNPNSDRYLFAVAATSPTNAWAVGEFEYTSPDGILRTKTLTEHWDGTAWTAVPSPNPGPNSVLFAVAATSPTNAWAIGNFVTKRDGSYYNPALTEHWDGRSWTLVPS